LLGDLGGLSLIKSVCVCLFNYLHLSIEVILNDHDIVLAFCWSAVLVDQSGDLGSALVLAAAEELVVADRSEQGWLLLPDKLKV